METINDRIAAVIKATELTKTAFAKKLNLSQPFVSNICAGVSSPSDRTISDICKTFDVNENWLRTGAGEMFASISDLESEIALRLNIATGGRRPDFCRRFAAALAVLDDSGWELLEQLALRMARDKGIDLQAEHNSNLNLEQDAPLDKDAQE